MRFPSRWAVTAIFVIASGLPLLANAASVSGQGTWETTLQARSFDGGVTIGGYYDTDLNITWLADANAAKGSAFDDGYYVGDGAMTFASANAWVASLNFNGITGWRLPIVTDTGSSSCNFAYSGTDCGYNVDTSVNEMAHMFYNTLGNLAAFDANGNYQAGSGLSNTGPFSNLQTAFYWSSTQYSADSRFFLLFDFGSGLEDTRGYADDYWAWAVHNGDVGTAVAAVPVPAAVWLFGSGLLGLFGVARRKAA